MNRTSPAFGSADWAIILLTAATAIIHLVLAFSFPGGADISFVLNGVGYLGLLGLMYLPLPMLAPFRSMARWALLALTLITIVAWAVMWFAMGGYSAGLATIAYVTKAIEIALAALLWLGRSR